MRTQVLAEIGGDELSSSQWAEAAGISQHSLDRILWNGKQSEERIVRCYSRLVFSVANSHQGRGLSLQDLTQVSSSTLMHFFTKIVMFFCLKKIGFWTAGRQHRSSSWGDQIRSGKGLYAINIRVLVD